MLLVARNSVRRHEFRLRLALGATRLQLFRQLLAESLVLVGAGTALGWLFATWATEAMVAWAAMDFNISPDQTVFAFTLALSAFAALLFGLAPLRNAVRAPPDLPQDLRPQLNARQEATAPRAGRGGFSNFSLPRAARMRQPVIAHAAKSGNFGPWVAHPRAARIRHHTAAR